MGSTRLVIGWLATLVPYSDGSFYGSFSGAVRRGRPERLFDVPPWLTSESGARMRAERMESRELRTTVVNRSGRRVVRNYTQMVNLVGWCLLLL